MQSFIVWKLSATKL